jgi:large subunit ribosomal protein L5e
MAFVKIVKNKAYSKRMQVKPKRRRQGKTDYFARRKLVYQDKNKYDSKKYRLVVRRTCSKVICQVIYATMTGDRVLCAADSSELKNHGVNAGLTNYAAHYATGLLLARRLLKQVGLADMYKSNSDVNGQYFNVDEDTQYKRPFKALLDVGINRTTTGARMFGALKGACDGGVNVPHNTKRFPGFSRGVKTAIENKKGKKIDSEKTEDVYDAKVHRDRIFGVHVTNYMNQLKKEDPAKFKRQFSQWEKNLTAAKAKTCEDLYKKVHAAIIANPDRKAHKATKPTRKTVTAGKALVQQDSKGRKWIRHFRITTDQRRERVAAKFQAAMANAGN